MQMEEFKCFVGFKTAASPKLSRKLSTVTEFTQRVSSLVCVCELSMTARHTTVQIHMVHTGLTWLFLGVLSKILRSPLAPEVQLSVSTA